MLRSATAILYQEWSFPICPTIVLNESTFDGYQGISQLGSTDNALTTITAQSKRNANNTVVTTSMASSFLCMPNLYQIKFSLLTRQLSNGIAEGLHVLRTKVTAVEGEFCPTVPERTPITLHWSKFMRSVSQLTRDLTKPSKRMR
jgi:hypothetical protein